MLSRFRLPFNLAFFYPGGDAGTHSGTPVRLAPMSGFGTRHGPSLHRGIVMREKNLGYFFQETAARNADKTAIFDLFQGSERRITYAMLEARVERAAGLLRSIGLKFGDTLALLIGNRFEFIELFFGAMRAGVIPVPLNVKLGRDMLRFIIHDAGCRGAVLDMATRSDAADLVVQLGIPVRVAMGSPAAGWLDYEDSLAKAPALLDPPVIREDQQAFQPYTSGSTGRPKGVIHSHHGNLWNIRLTQEYWPTPETERGLISVSLSHKNAMRGTVKRMLFAGASFVLMPSFEPRAYLEALAGYRCTSSNGVPAMFKTLLTHRDLVEGLDFSELKYFTLGSSVVPQSLIDELEDAFPGVAVREGYGMTEGGSPFRPPIDGRKVPRGSCGMVAPEHEVKLVSPDGMTRTDLGELWVRSPYVPKGYHKLPDLTRDRIRDGWLRTGDVFSVDGKGFYYFRGRTDDMFNCGGENIYPKEVENLLIAHCDVLDACVVPVAHRVKGFVPAAVVVRRPGAAVTEGDIKNHCLVIGPAYLHPRTIVFVEDMPKLGSDKVDRQAVQRLVDRHLGLPADERVSR